MNYTHLTTEERYQIDDLQSEGFSKKEIANQLGRAASTIYREMTRNKGEREWRSHQADNLAKKRLKIRGQANCQKVNEVAWKYAKSQLVRLQLSPQQIAQRLIFEGLASISHETIYKRISANKKEGGELYKHLRCQKQRRRRYGSRKSRPKIQNRVGIELRPAIVEKRIRIGDWEGDTIIGAGCNSGAIVSIVDRCSRFTILAKVKDKRPAGVTKAIINKLKPYIEFLHTMTVDNGGEFSFHEKITQALDMKIYFATPYSSWERGSNENTNGLIRQYFKKTMRFDTLTNEEVQRVANKLNHRPRKCLGYQTPYEVFCKACKKMDVALRV